MGVDGIADALGLTRRGPEWSGPRGDARVGVRGARGAGAGVILWAEHPIPLRAGLLLDERSGILDVGGRTAVASRATLRGLADLTEPGSALRVRIRARALEADVVRALLTACGARVLALASSGELAIDDQRVWIAWPGALSAAGADALIDEMVELSRDLVLARREVSASFERALGATWSELASTLELTWSPERSAITGERRGASIELRIDGEPGLLYTELYLEWRSIRQGLRVERCAHRGRAGTEPSDGPAVAAAFEAAHRVKGRFEPTPEMMRGALSVGATGASLLVDDTGLVARVDEVLVDPARIGALLRGGLALGLGLCAPRSASGVYR